MSNIESSEKEVDLSQSKCSNCDKTFDKKQEFKSTFECSTDHVTFCSKQCNDNCYFNKVCRYCYCYKNIEEDNFIEVNGNKFCKDISTFDDDDSDDEYTFPEGTNCSIRFEVVNAKCLFCKDDIDNHNYEYDPDEFIEHDNVLSSLCSKCSNTLQKNTNIKCELCSKRNSTVGVNNYNNSIIRLCTKCNNIKEKFNDKLELIPFE